MWLNLGPWYGEISLDYLTDPTIRGVIRVRQESDSKRRYEDRSRGLRVRERYEDRGRSHKPKYSGSH